MSGELSVKYLGLELPSPVFVGACPLAMESETVRQFIGAGAGAIVLPSILQEQVIHRLMKPVDPLNAIEQSGYQPQQDRYNGGAEGYLRSISSLKETTRVPIIASINGHSGGAWLRYAKEIESAGADALEFNLQSTIIDANASSDSIESSLCNMVADVVGQISIPVSVKITQRYTNLASMVRQLYNAGAKGVTLFTHQPHWDVSTDRMHWTINWELSPVNSIGMILEGLVRICHGKSGLSIAASGGIATSEDALKAMIAGADVVMVTSAVYREGPDVIRKMIDGIRRYLEFRRHSTLSEFLRQRSTVGPCTERMVRLEYVDPLTRSKTYFDPTPNVSQASSSVHGQGQG
jgi:dihydroorotate dehydrogenase (fumarate)